MLLFLKIVLIVLLGLVSINFVRYIARIEKETVIEIEQDFEVRFPRVYLFICVVFFLLVLVLVPTVKAKRQQAFAED